MFFGTLRLHADTMALSYAAISLVFAGLVAEQSSVCNLAKYSELAISHIFLPIAMVSFGPIRAVAPGHFFFSTSVHSHSTF